MLVSIPIPNTKSDIYTKPQINNDKKNKRNNNHNEDDQYDNNNNNTINAKILVNSQLTDYRYLINKNDLMNSSNQLIDYLNTIFQFLFLNYNNNNNSNNEIDINSLIRFSKNHILFKNIKLSNLPWDNYQKITTTSNNNNNNNNEINWYLYDEILACINSISSIYSQLTCDSIQFLLSEDNISNLNNNSNNNNNDNKWKKPSNLVKNSFVFIKIIEDYNNRFNNTSNIKTNEIINNLHQLNYNINLHYSNFLIQLIVLIKDIWLIDLNDYQLNKLPKFNNTYLRILIYINNEFKILKNLLLSSSSSSSLTLDSNSNSLNYSLNSIQIFLNSMLCYYLSINYYYKNSNENQNLGISIGLIKYVLLITLDQDKFSSKFKTTSSISSSIDKKLNGENKKENKFKKLINLKKDSKNDNNNSNQEKDSNIFKEIKLNKLLNNNLDNYLKILIIKLINLLKLLNFKFEKENNNLKFDKILNNLNEIESNYLFNSNNLPTGLNIPINFIKFNPICLSSSSSSSYSNNDSINTNLNLNSDKNYF
ncbi:unnamed protein product [[Candida] boidinii]|nr:unnamed protein product [[Candida] boidinii]